MENIFNTFTKEDKTAIIESLIFAADESLSAKVIAKIINDYYGIEKGTEEEITESEIIELIYIIEEDLANSGRPYQLVNFAGGWQFATRKEYGEIVAKYIKSKTKKRLSQAALESLAIIAYKQPISKPMIESIRGVNSNEVVNTLMDKGFVRIIGKSDALGHPYLYVTTEDFLVKFGINSIADLPKLKDIDEIVLESENIQPESEVLIDVSALDKDNFQNLVNSGLVNEVDNKNESEV